MSPQLPTPDRPDPVAPHPRAARTSRERSAAGRTSQPKPGAGRGAVALAAQALAEASTQLRQALARELGEAGADATQKLASSLQEAARSLDEVAARVAPSDKSKRTREELLAAAATVFSARGYEGASVGEIAEAAGYTKGALYAHFGSKEQLFLELARSYSRESIEQTRTADTGGQAFIEWFCGAIPQALQAKPEIGLAVLNMEFILFGLRHPQYRAEIVELATASTEALAQRLSQDSGKAGAITPQDYASAMGAAALSNQLLMAFYLGTPGVDSDTAVRLLRRVTTPGPDEE